MQNEQQMSMVSNMAHAATEPQSLREAQQALALAEQMVTAMQHVVARIDRLEQTVQRLERQQQMREQSQPQEERPGQPSKDVVGSVWGKGMSQARQPIGTE